jgi:hypothetical protein
MSNCDNWEDDWENDDDMDAKLKANIEETKRKEIQHLVDNAEEQLIEDLFLTPLFAGTSAVGATVGRSPSRKPPSRMGDLVQHGGLKAPTLYVFAPLFPKVDLVQHGGFPRDPVNLPPKGEFGPTFSKGWNANMKNKEKSSLNKDNEQKLLEQKKKQIALKKRQDELFGDASLDAIQDQYCDLEDRY